MLIKIQKYHENLKHEWDQLIDESSNGHFMFKRDFMEYHKHRYIDYSLLIYGDDKLIAVLPVSIQTKIVTSHAGLTFGGLIVKDRINIEKTVLLFQEISAHLKEEGIKKFIYKRIPDFYHKKIINEDLYALFRLGASVTRRDVTSVIDLSEKYAYSKGRKWSINKARKAGLEVSKVINPTNFWNLLTDVLMTQHGKEPVHSIDEIKKLMKLFPQNIHCYEVNLGTDLHAGALIFETSFVTHTQYLANSVAGRQNGALDFLIDKLLREYHCEKRFFNFGVSTTNQGKEINSGLFSQKTSFGAYPMMQDFYEIEI